MTATISKNTREKNNWNSSEKKSLHLQTHDHQTHVIFQLKSSNEIFLSLLENTFEIPSLILVKTVNSGRFHPYVLLR